LVPRRPDSDTYDLILLAPAHPVFIRLGRPGRRRGGSRECGFGYAEQLVKQNDRNGRRRPSTRRRRKRIAPLVKSSNANETFSISESWVAVDRDPADDQVTAKEAGGLGSIRILGFPFFALGPVPKRATQSVDLFSLLDVNHDGRLTAGGAGGRRADVA